MSHMVTTNVKISIDRRGALVTALKNLGYKNVSNNAVATPLRNYYGENQGSAHVIVHQSRGGDIGFEFKQDGMAVLHGDSMYVGQSFQDKLLQQYTKCVIEEVASEQGWGIEEETTNTKGEIVVTVSSQW